MPRLVKGYGMHMPGTPQPLGAQPVIQGELRDQAKLDELEAVAEATLKGVIHTGLTKPGSVYKSFTPELGNAMRTLNMFSPQAMSMQTLGSQWSKQIGAAVVLKALAGRGLVEVAGA